MQAVAYISKAFGSLAFISRLKDNLRDMAKPSAKMVAPPAAMYVGVKGFEDIAKTMAVAAFSAQAGGAPSKSENEWLGDIAKSLDDVKKDNRSLGTVITEGAWKALDKTWDRFTEWYRRTHVGRAVH